MRPLFNSEHRLFYFSRGIGIQACGFHNDIKRNS